MEPSPSCPVPFAPQHHKEPPARTPQVAKLPAETCSQSLSSPMRTGCALESVVPLPNCPQPLSPQHQSVESLRIAQAWRAPIDTWAQLLAEPTRTGLRRVAVSPNPSCSKLLNPQHQRVSSLRIAHADRSPSTTSDQVWAASMGIGQAWDSKPPLPSCPLPFDPQHHNLPAESMPHECSEPSDIDCHWATVSTNSTVSPVWEMGALISSNFAPAVDERSVHFDSPRESVSVHPPMILSLPDASKTGITPATLFPKVSRSVIVTIEGVCPSAGIRVVPRMMADCATASAATTRKGDEDASAMALPARLSEAVST